MEITLYLGNKSDMEPGKEDKFERIAVATALAKYVAGILAGDELEVEGVAPGCGCDVIKTCLVEDGQPHICLAGAQHSARAH